MGSAQLQGELWGRHAATWAAGMERRMAPLFKAALDALAPPAPRFVAVRIQVRRK